MSQGLEFSSIYVAYSYIIATPERIAKDSKLPFMSLWKKPSANEYSLQLLLTIETHLRLIDRRWLHRLM